MARKANSAAIGWLILLAPVAWVCNLCSGDSPPSSPPPAVAPDHEPEPKAFVELPAEVEPEPAVEPEPPAPKKKRKAKKKRRAKKTRAAEPKDEPSEDILSAVQDAAKPASAPKPVRAARTCCKHCGPSSKPCGTSCISRRYTCHKGPGCAC